MSKRDKVFVQLVFFQVFRDNEKDFRRNPVDRSKIVLHGPNQAEYSQRVLFENVDL